MSGGQPPHPRQPPPPAAPHPPLHRRLRWQRALGSRGTYELREGTAWLGSLRMGRLGAPAVLDLGGRRWRVAIGRLAGVRVTVSDERSGEVLARKAVRTLEITGGPRLTWRPRWFDRPRPAFVREDGEAVAEFTMFDGRGLDVRVGSGDHGLDVLCAVVGGVMLIRLKRNLPPSATG